MPIITPNMMHSFCMDTQKRVMIDSLELKSFTTPPIKFGLTHTCVHGSVYTDTLMAIRITVREAFMDKSRWQRKFRSEAQRKT